MLFRLIDRFSPNFRSFLLKFAIIKITCIFRILYFKYVIYDYYTDDIIFVTMLLLSVEVT